jgi:hypothetical protein
MFRIEMLQPSADADIEVTWADVAVVALEHSGAATSPYKTVGEPEHHRS